jgi:hypothetical protein
LDLIFDLCDGWFGYAETSLIIIRGGIIMKKSFRFHRPVVINVFIATVVLLLCSSLQAKTPVTDHPLVTGEIPRPAMIWVYAFASSPTDIPANSVLAPLKEGAAPLTASEISTGVALGTEMATELVQQINAMGLMAQVADANSMPAVNDIVLRGYFISMTKGSDKKRFIIGCSSGAAELKVAMEGFEVTDSGVKPLGSGTADAGKGGYSPGAGIGLLSFAATKNPLGLIISTGVKLHDKKTGKDAVSGKSRDDVKAIAKVLKKRFEAQGWLVSQ